MLSKEPKARFDRKRYPIDPGLTIPFNEIDIVAGINAVKHGKVTRLDDIQTELIKHFVRQVIGCTASSTTVSTVTKYTSSGGK